jgi:hypothetical protein
MSIEMTQKDMEESISVYVGLHKKGVITEEQMVKQIANYFWQSYSQDRKEVNFLLQLLSMACAAGEAAVDPNGAEQLQEIKKGLEGLAKERGVSINNEEVLMMMTPDPDPNIWEDGLVPVDVHKKP